MTAEFLAEADDLSRFGSPDRFAAAAGIAPVLRASGSVSYQWRAKRGNRVLKRVLEEAREILRGFEETALAGVAAQLSAAAESLAETAEVLHRIRPGQWVDREGIRAHLAGRTEDQFEKIASEVPKHYLSERVAIYNVLEVDEWVMGR